MGPKIKDLGPILSKNTRPVAAIKSLRFALFHLNFIFIRPSLDGAYYGMAMSVRPSVRPIVST